MRGKDSLVDKFWNKIRITPAYAGKSTSYTVLTKTYRDHPRLCGEKYLLCGLFNVLRGSPPPMRGKVQSLAVCFNITGITPAYAGKRKQMCNFFGIP